MCSGVGNMRLVFLGPPGAGKGTLAESVAAAFGLTHLSSGDMLRAAIAAGTPLGSKVKGYVEAGKLVPQEILGEVVAARLAEVGGFVLDGYPRTVEQADFLGRLPGVSLEAVIYVTVPEEEAVRRLLGRRVCSVCGALVNTEELDSENCPACGGALVARADDAPATIKKRYEIYQKETAPLVSYYRAGGLLREIDGVGPRPEVLSRLEAELAPLAACGHDNG